jgi:sugar-specific transcriptional regulator TrmB
MNLIKITSELNKIGLSEKEAGVYTALINLGGGAFPSAVAAEAHLNRSTTYKLLTSLGIKGLVNEIKKRNKSFYQVEKPERLLRYAKNQVQFAEDRLDTVEKLFPELQGLFALTNNKPKVLFFEGAEEIEAIYQDCISEKKPYEMLAFSNAKKFKQFIKPAELRHFVKEKERLGITTRAIVPDTEDDRAYNSAVFPGIEKKFWPVIKFIPAKLFPFEAEITIYGNNKVGITKLGSHNIIGVIIEDEVIHGMMRMIFELAWRGCEK